MAGNGQVHGNSGIDLLFSIGPFEDKPATPIPAEGATEDAAKLDARATRLAWSPDGTTLAVPSRNSVVYLCDGDTGDIVRKLVGHHKETLSAAWSPDGTRLASGGWDKTVRIWNVSGGTTIEVLEGFAREVNTVAWSPDGSRLAASDEDNGIGLWDTSNWRPVGRLKPSNASHVAWSPDGAYLACASTDDPQEDGIRRREAGRSRSGGITIWNMKTMKPCAALEGHTESSAMVAWSPDSRVLASAAKDGTVRLWDTVEETLLTTVDIADDYRQAAGLAPFPGKRAIQVIALTFMSDGGILAAKCRDNIVRLWDCTSWLRVGQFDESATDSGWCVGLSFHPSLPRLASLGEEDTIVRVWSLDPDLLLIAAQDPDRL